MTEHSTHALSAPLSDEVSKNGPLVRSWELIVQAIAGSCRVRNLPAPEVLAVGEWLASLELDLDHQCTAADRSILGSLGRVALLEFRLARSCFADGVQTKDGETKGALTEMRQIVKLKADLLGKLSFKNSPVTDVPSIRDLWPSSPSDVDRKAPPRPEAPASAPPPDGPSAPSPEVPRG